MAEARAVARAVARAGDEEVAVLVDLPMACTARPDTSI